MNELAILCLFISIIQFICINYFLHRLNPYSSIVHFFLSYQVIFLQFIPLLINIVIDKNEINYVFLLKAYIINFIYFFIFLYLYSSYSIGNFFKPNNLKNYYLIIILSIVNLFNLLTMFKVDLNYYTFPFFLFLNGIAKVFPFIGVLFFYNRSKFLNIYIIITTSVYFISVVGMGMRSLIIMPIFYVIFYSSKIKIIKKFSVLLVITIIFVPVSGYFKSLRDTSESTTKSFAISGLPEFVDELSFRLNENNKITAGIVELIEVNGAVGSAPLISSMQAIVPSFFYDNGKPWPGSIDGSPFGILARQAHDFVYGAIWNMSEYMYTLHPIWEFGYPYYFFNIFITLVWILLIEKISWRLGDKIAIIPICSFMPFTYSIVIQPIVIIFQTMAYITIPGFIFLVLFKFIIKFKDNR